MNWKHIFDQIRPQWIGTELDKIKCQQMKQSGDTVYLPNKYKRLQRGKKRGWLKDKQICMLAKELCPGSVASDNMSIRTSPHRWAVTKQKKRREEGREAGREDWGWGHTEAEAQRIKRENRLRSAIQLWSKGSGLQRLFCVRLQHWFC